MQVLVLVLINAVDFYKLLFCMIKVSILSALPNTEYRIPNTYHNYTNIRYCGLRNHSTGEPKS